MNKSIEFTIRPACRVGWPHHVYLEWWCHESGHFESVFIRESTAKRIATAVRIVDEELPFIHERLDLLTRTVKTVHHISQNPGL